MAETALSASAISESPHSPTFFTIFPINLSALPSSLNGVKMTPITPAITFKTPAIIRLTSVTILIKSFTKTQSTVNINGSLMRILLYGIGLLPP